MNISIVGPGALGILFATKCSVAGHTTTLIDYTAERAQRLSISGLSVETDTATITASPRVSTCVPDNQDLIIVLTKSYTTNTLKLPNTCPVLSLQNGLGNVETLCTLVDSANVIAGTTSEASTLLREGVIRHAASGITTLGAWTSCPTKQTEEALQEAGFNVQITHAPSQMLWEKTVINAGINPLTAILNIPNGDLLKKEETRQLMHDLITEAIEAATTEGHHFDHRLAEKAEEVCSNTATNISSMLQDIRANRKTEIDAISGEILRRCTTSSIPAPRTRRVIQWIKSMEKNT